MADVTLFLFFQLPLGVLFWGMVIATLIGVYKILRSNF
jgi:hypothetical protein